MPTIGAAYMPAGAGGAGPKPAWSNFTPTQLGTPLWAKYSAVTPGSYDSIMSRPDMQRRSTRTRADVMGSAQSAADKYRRQTGNNAGSAAQESLLGLLGGAQASRAADEMFQSERGFLTDVGFKNAANDLQTQFANLSASLQNNQNTIAQDAQRLSDIANQREIALGNRNAGINEMLGKGRLDLDRWQAQAGNEFNWADMANRYGLEYAQLNQQGNQFNQGQQMDYLQGLIGAMTSAGYNPLAALPAILQSIGGVNIPGYQTPSNLGELIASLGMSNNSANTDSANAANANSQNQSLMDLITALFGGMMNSGGSGA